MKKDYGVSKSWFCVFPNPEKHFYDGAPEEIVHKMIETWIEDNPQRTCAISYCVSADGLPHLHAVLEDTKALRFSAIKKIFPSMHIEPTKGNKTQAEDYILKKPPFDEAGEKIIYIGRHGEIKGRQGSRNDLEIISDLIDNGLTPNQILDMLIQYRRYEKIIRDSYYRKRFKETPTQREVTVYWHTGESGSGKSYTEVKLAKKHGEDFVYKIIDDKEKGFTDKYSGEPILFIDEMRGRIPYTQLLTMLDCYKSQIHARYTNIIGLWTEVHITSVFTPDILYQKMISNNKTIDTYEQLRRRINYMVYHYKKDGEYFAYELPMSEYENYQQLKRKAYSETGNGYTSENPSLFEMFPDDKPTPFDIQ